MADANSFDALIERFISERLTPDELPVFFRFLEEKDFQRRYAGRIDMDLIEETWLGWSNEQQAGRLYSNILQAGNIPVSEMAFATDPDTDENVRRLPLRRIYRWPRYAAAAAILLLAGVAIYRYQAKRQVIQQQVAHVEQQKSAVGTVSGARLDQPEIGDQDAVLRDVFDAADEIGEGRVHLFDDRRRLVPTAVADEDVDLVTLE